MKWQYLGTKSKHLPLDFKTSFGLWFQIINQNKGVVCMYFLNKIVELLKSEHRSKSIADCWLHIETTCLFDPDWVSKQGCCYCCCLARQLQAGYSSCTEQSKQFSFVATAKTVCTKWKQFDNKQIERLGDWNRCSRITPI